MIRTCYKKIIILIILIFLCVTNWCFADEIQNLFKQGNQYFQNQNYSEAISSYQQIIGMKYESGSLYYNMGNCYYKSGQIGKAILYYERAKRFLPRDEDLKENLALANLSVVDKIKEQPQFILFRFWSGFVHFIPQKVLIWFVLGLYLLTILFLILWIVGKNLGFRFTIIRVVVVVGVVFLIFGLALIGQIQEGKNRIFAVILVDKVDVMSAPSESSGMEMFALHEGTKVRLDKFSGQWVKIVLPDLKVGWVKKETLEVI